ncbi:MAG: winged helix DNA-binding domain-containing protein [Brooklawnia sp.]|uniref:winged helix DNA-binding domain-containing protein n=1 Tax=Brooklawnia sp. TaxID=2699740 RepID=UPI003C74A08E
MAVRKIDERERRARLAVRHGLHPAHRLADVLATTRAMTALHATEAPSVYLSVQARTIDVTPADIDHALYVERSVVKQLAMRRTLFVFPRDLLAATLGSASARVAIEQRRLITRDVEQHGVADDGAAWLASATAAIQRRLSGSEPLSARQLREEVPELTGTVAVNPDKKYGGTFPIAPRVLTMMGAEGVVTRGPNAGNWWTARLTWTLMDEWLGGHVTPLSPEEGYAELVRRWLRTFGPGTLDDIQWWLGSTKNAARAALAAVDAVPVELAGGATGWLLPDDVEPVAEVGPWAALLPTLDPTTMGWRSRDFYLDPAHTRLLFDSNGNGGNTAWWDGRIVGTWVQDDAAAVQVILLPGVGQFVGKMGRAALDAEAGRLTRWLDGVRITNVYKSQLMTGRSLP